MTSDGVPVTDELVDRLAAEAEEGYDVEVLRHGGWGRSLGPAAGEAERK